MLFSFESWDGDSLSIAFKELVSSRTWVLHFAEIASEGTAYFDLSRSFCFISKIIGARSRTKTCSFVTSFGFSYFGSWHGSFTSNIIRTRTGIVIGCIFFVCFLCYCTSFCECIHIVDIILTWTWSLIESTVCFDLVAETVFGTCTDGSVLAILTWTWILVIIAKTASFGFTHFCSSKFELWVDIVVSWSWLWILDSIAVFGSHGESWGIFVDWIGLDVVVTWSWCKCLSEGVSFGFRTHCYFGTGFAIGEVVVSWSWYIIEFGASSSCVADSWWMKIYFQEGWCLPILTDEL